jgi:hypothetical protein
LSSLKINNKKIFLYLLILVFIFLFARCSSTEKVSIEESNNNQVDLSGYSPLDIFLSENSKDTSSQQPKENIWQSYETESSQKQKLLQKQFLSSSFYTIQVLISDNLLEIDSLKKELHSIIPELKQNVLYDPPFYKLRLGEFQTKLQANKFLNILEKNGYITSRIISDRRR